MTSDAASLLIYFQLKDPSFAMTILSRSSLRIFFSFLSSALDSDSITSASVALLDEMTLLTLADIEATDFLFGDCSTSPSSRLRFADVFGGATSGFVSATGFVVGAFCGCCCCCCCCCPFFPFAPSYFSTSLMHEVCDRHSAGL